MEITKGDKYIHYKTQNIYEIVDVAVLQAPDESGIDMCECVIYKKQNDQKLWVRPVKMFLEKVKNENGVLVARFEKYDFN